MHTVIITHTIPMPYGSRCVDSSVNIITSFEKWVESLGMDSSKVKTKTSANGFRYKELDLGNSYYMMYL